MSETSGYHPEPYWSKVAKRITKRADGTLVAGDDEPYYRYKRAKFLDLLDSVDVSGKTVLEIGQGPGGNLQFLTKKDPSKLVGVDISTEMVNLAKSNLPEDVEIIKIDGTSLPFPDQSFDIVFTATVLQHNTDHEMLGKLVDEICRVSKDQVVLFERIESGLVGDELCEGRPVFFYERLMALNGFILKETRHMNIFVSYLTAGSIRKLFNPKAREEGEPLNRFSIMLQKLLLPGTKQLDKVFTRNEDVTKMDFKRESA